MKKNIYALVILCILLTFTACGGDTPGPSDASGGISEELTSTAMGETASAEASEEAPESTAPEEPASATGTTPTEPSSSKAASTTDTKSADATKPPASSQPPVSTAPPVVINDAKSTDGAAIANKIIEYINEYRVAQGAGKADILPKLTKVAEHRSRQLVTNYDHDTNDEREAARIYQYGEHIVNEEYGVDYYRTYAGEAIGRSGGNASVDEIAQRMASGFKNSADHWSYVGAARNKYIAVGATYGNGQWYICILTTEIDTYG